MRALFRLRLAACVALAAALGAAACSGPEPGSIQVVGPSFDQFAGVGPDGGVGQTVSVGDAMDRRCGSLDCHGQPGRNMRLWGHDGMRLSSGNRPGVQRTTRREYEYSYRSIVALEPKKMAEVVRQHGVHPERLTMIAKARGLERHKGGHITNAGDPLDRCMVSWLAGNVDTAACAAATPPLQ